MVFLRAKVVVIGDSFVGKTSLCKTLCSEANLFSKVYENTIMSELFIKQVHLPETGDTVELFLFDSSGSSLYTETLKDTWINADLVCLVYDVGNHDTFTHIKLWYEKVYDSIKPNIIGCILGNKSDAPGPSGISDFTIRRMCELVKMKHFECSAKDNKNVNDPFKHMVNEYVRKYRQRCDQLGKLAQLNITNNDEN